MSYRNRKTEALCGECRKGRVVPMSRYYNYWTSRLSMEEIREIAQGIWG